jgi:hypothetical protein
LPKAGTPIKAAQGKNLEVVIEALQQAQARQSLVPRLVTLQGDAIPVSQALQEIARQTEIEVEDQRQNAGDVRLKLDLKGVTFWQALDAVAREADARVYPYRGGKVALVDGPHHQMPTSYHGIFRVAIKRIAAVRDLETDAHFYIALMEVAWEPRFRPFLLDTRPQSLVVKDDKDRTLPVPDEGGGKAPVENPIAMTIEMRLPAPDRSAKKFALVKGSLAVVGPSKMLEFVFGPLDQLLTNVQAREQTQEGITVRLAQPVLDRVWRLDVTLVYPPDGPDFESFQSWLVNNEIYLLKEKTGDRFPNNGGYATDAIARNRASITYYFIEEKKLPRGKPSDWKVVYRTPGAIVEIPVPFEFKDLMLP